MQAIATERPDSQPAEPAGNGRRKSGRPLILHKRFQLAGALLFAAVLPYVARYPLETWSIITSLKNSNGLIGNILAVLIATWVRLAISSYPGIRASYLLLPAIIAGHGSVVLAFSLTQIPFDRLSVTIGFGLHILWTYAIYLAGERRVRPRIAIVPAGKAPLLASIPRVDWVTLKSPRLEDMPACTALVADFSSLPDDWEEFLADAAVGGVLVYQVKQLSESLTGRVELAHLSENSFGSLLPARGYFHIKTIADFLFAVAVLPFAVPVMIAAALAIKFEGGGPILFRQTRIGHAGRPFKVYKFRTMKVAADGGDERAAAMTIDADPRVTRVGAFLRHTRIDELPQIFNIWELYR